MKTPIYTTRLILRPLADHDLEDVLAITGLSETYQFIPEKPMSEMTARNLIQRGQNNPGLDDLPPDIAITLSKTNELIGLLSFNIISARFRTVEIGWMVHSAHRGKGYASEAACALINYGFSTLGIHRVIATCDPRNTPSVRIMERLGMHREAEFFESVRLDDGEWHNEYLYAITEKEWGNNLNQKGIELFLKALFWPFLNACVSDKDPISNGERS